MKATEYNELLYDTQKAIHSSIATCTRYAPDAATRLERIEDFAHEQTFCLFVGENGTWDWY